MSTSLIINTKNKTDKLAVMDVRDIRLINARALAEEAGSITKFADIVGVSSSQASQSIGKNPTRFIGNDLARKIDRQFEKPAGWLDVLHDNELPEDAAELGAAWAALPEGERNYFRNMIFRELEIIRRAPELCVSLAAGRVYRGYSEGSLLGVPQKKELPQAATVATKRERIRNTRR